MANKFIPFAEDVILRSRQLLLNSPRELSGLVLPRLETSLARFEGDDSASIVDSWYRTATTASYGSVEAAAAYLGAYGPRSILKIQEAVFALLLLKGGLDQKLTVIDYGAGPGLGFAALIDLMSVLSEVSSLAFGIHYIGVDRSQSMRQVGSDLCTRIKNGAPIDCTFQFIDTEEELPASDCLIVSNVFNEGEGCEEIQPAFRKILERTNGVRDIVVIEPATKHAAKQMCSLADGFESLKHIGPCPSANSGCTQWTFRKFTKRIYAFERRCLGKWATAAEMAKYALALLSYEAPIRSIPDGTRVVAGQPLPSNRALTCRFGDKRFLQVAPGSATWDVVNAAGNVETWWP